MDRNLLTYFFMPNSVNLFELIGVAIISQRST